MSGYESETPALVLDNGSYSLKVGFAGEDIPRHEVRSLLSRGSDVSSGVSATTATTKGLNKVSFHDAAVAAVDADRPIIGGVVVDWDAMEKLWKLTFDDAMKASTSDHPLIITESPLNEGEAREQMAEILFEKFDSPAL